MDRGAWWAIVQGVTKSQKKMGNVDFNNALHLTQHVQSILTCNQYKLGILLTLF